MSRMVLVTVLFMTSAVSAHAHFMWIVPVDENKAKVVFSDNLEPDDASLLSRIEKTELGVKSPEGKVEAIKWTKGDDAYIVDLKGKTPCTLAGHCCYGVFQRGDKDPMLLTYYTKSQVPGAATSPSMNWDKLPFEIVSSDPKKPTSFKVLWQGKPLGDAEVRVLAPGADKSDKLKADANGCFEIKDAKAGMYGLQASHIVKKDGERDGKKYKAERHITTLTVKVAK